MRRISGNKSDVRADAEAPARTSTRCIAKSMLRCGLFLLHYMVTGQSSGLSRISSGSVSRATSNGAIVSKQGPGSTR